MTSMREPGPHRTPARLRPKSAALRAAPLVLAVLAVLLLAAGCASIRVREVGDSTDGGVDGVRFYLPKPYLLVHPEGAPGPLWEVIYLPDYDDAYEISARSFLLGVSVDLAQGLFLEGVSFGASRATGRGTPTRPPLAGTLPPGGPTLSAEGSPGLPPGLYAIETRGEPSDGSKLVRLGTSPALEPRPGRRVLTSASVHPCGCVAGASCPAPTPAPETPPTWILDTLDATDGEIPPAPRASVHFQSQDGRTADRFVVAFDDPEAERDQLAGSEVLAVADGEEEVCRFLGTDEEATLADPGCTLAWLSDDHHRLAVGRLLRPARRVLLSITPRAGERWGPPSVASFEGTSEAPPAEHPLTRREVEVELTNDDTAIESVRLVAHGRLGELGDSRASVEADAAQGRDPARAPSLPRCPPPSDEDPACLAVSRSEEDAQGLGLLVLEVRGLERKTEPFTLELDVRDRLDRVMLRHSLTLDPTRVSSE